MLLATKIKGKCVKRVFFFLLGIFFATAHWAASATTNYLQDITSKLSEGSLTVRIDFNEPVLHHESPVFNNTSVLVDVPNAFVQPAKRFVYTGDSRMPQIFISQLSPQVLRMQFVLGSQIANLKESFQVENQGRSLVFHIFKKEEDVLSEFLARAAEKLDLKGDLKNEAIPDSSESTVKTPAHSLEEIENVSFVDKVPGKNAGSQEPVNKKTVSGESMGGENSRKSDSGKPLDLVSTTVKTLAMFALVLGLMFLVFYLFKRFVWKSTLFGGSNKLIQVLGTGFLGPKKNIVLVEVAGEVLVLGMSSDHISLLSHIQDKERIEKIKAAGRDNNPGALWTQLTAKKTASHPQALHSKEGGLFSKYLRQFSADATEKEKSVEEVTDQIRKNLSRLKTL